MKAVCAYVFLAKSVLRMRRNCYFEVQRVIGRIGTEALR